jgi:hypothetical protein
MEIVLEMMAIMMMMTLQLGLIHRQAKVLQNIVW